MANGRFLTQAQVKAVLAEIENPLWRTAVLTTYHHGLRVSETINIRGRDLRGGHLKVNRLKDSETTDQPFVPSPDPELDESAALHDLYRTTARGDRVFPITRDGFYKLFAKAAKRAGLDEKCRNPHILKHSIAHHLLEDHKRGIHVVQQWLGHASLSSTGEYLKMSGEQVNASVLAAVGRSPVSPALP